MNREIKFRGKRIDNGEWVCGAYSPYSWINGGRENEPLIIIISNDTNDGTCHGVVPETAGQYTGLKDKNGVEIYEGDVIRLTNHVDEVYEEVGIVGFDMSECGYKATYKTREYNNVMGRYVRTNCIYLINNKEYECEYEVIGNIRDNPKLLEGHK